MSGPVRRGDRQAPRRPEGEPVRRLASPPPPRRRRDRLADYDDAGGIYVAPEPVGGDVVLSGDGATADLSARSAERLSGRAIALAGVVVVAGVLLARVLGWARTSVFLAEFGGSGRLDPFFNAFSIPDTLFQLVAAGAVGSALVPVASGLLATGESERARRLVSTIANLTVIALVPLVVVAWLWAPSIMNVIAYMTPTPFDTTPMTTEIALTRVMLLSPVFLALGAVMAAGLNAAGIFGAPAMAPNVYNLAIIVAAIVLSPFMGVYALALGVVAGAAGHLFVQLRAVREAGLYRPVLAVHDPAVRETLLLMAPRALGLGATQIVFVVNRYFATSLGLGAVTAYTAAFTALQIPVGLIGVPLGIVMLPPMSQAIARGEDSRFKVLVDQSLRLLLFVVVPMTVMMFSLARPILALLYRYGSETTAQVDAMVPVFEVFLLGLIAHVLIAMLAPIFYAGKDTRTPVTAALISVAVDVAAAAVFFIPFGLAGIALAISIGAWVEVLILGALMERRIGFDLRPLARDSIAFAGGGAVAAAASYLVARWVETITGGPGYFVGRVTELVPAGLVGLGVYLAWARLLRLPELDGAIALGRTLVGRGFRSRATVRPPAGEDEDDGWDDGPGRRSRGRR